MIISIMFEPSNPADLEIKFIREIIDKRPILRRINAHISEQEEFKCSSFANGTPPKERIVCKRFDYVFDGLNIEGGRMNSFTECKKIMKNKKNKLKNKKILIVIRSPLKFQTKKEIKDCRNLVKKFSNIDIMYVHTAIKMKDKYYKLIESCKNNPYCTRREKKSKERLCVTPLLVAQEIRPLHNMCEVDDLLVYYFTLCFNSKVVSRTEKYSLNVKEKNINSFKLFMHIPITYYSRKNVKNILSERKMYIDPLFVYKNLLLMYKQNPMTEKQVIKIGKGTILK